MWTTSVVKFSFGDEQNFSASLRALLRKRCRWSSSLTSPKRETNPPDRPSILRYGRENEGILPASIGIPGPGYAAKMPRLKITRQRRLPYDA